MSVSLQKLEALQASLNSQVQGQEATINLCLTALLGQGHVLIEGPPGVGKTSLARGVSDAFSLQFSRIQMTSDLLPSEIVGVLRPSLDKQDFEFRKGPIFTHFLLVDELNRTSPKTQAALLEAMAENAVTVDGTTHALPLPFFVMATQNSLESHGVYPLVESQLDRFMLYLEMNLPALGKESAIYRTLNERTDRLLVRPMLSGEDLLTLQGQVSQVFLEDSVLEYGLRIMQGTRDHALVNYGVSVRGGKQLFRAAKALAFLKGRDYVTPADLKEVAVPCLAHRIQLKDQVFQMSAKRAVLDEITEQVRQPS